MALNYSKEVMDHFLNPRNIGVIEDPDAYIEVGNPTCGDMLSMYLKVKEVNKKKIVEDLKFLSFGCASNISTASMMTTQVIGKTIEDAKNFSFKEIMDELGGLPSQKIHCSVLAVEALHGVIKKYEEKLINDK